VTRFQAWTDHSIFRKFEAMSDRLEKLQQMLAREPNDTFLLYGIALEHKKAGDMLRAIEHLDRVIQSDPKYFYAYHQRGLAYEEQGDLESAKKSFREGIEAAEKNGDSHAAEEIRAALMMIE
jgi:Tfp pilus assembly protein PilF